MNPLHDDELDRALQCWRVPDPPPHLEAKTIEACGSGFRRASVWRRLFTMRVRVPLPVVAAVVVVLVCLSMTLVRFELQRHPAGAAAGVSRELPKSSWDGLQPVAELRLRVIRGHDEGR
ncbi:MAG TPA: hypothetical protein VGZ73_05195 [Bryobacteraceae bacterium]|jgi:hypothetical protein|nr:hypothetical protein [Bryobacteraceae bacterium]